jgi:sulfatase maturation enzyme AslB (radical SAM superfamily)
LHLSIVGGDPLVRYRELELMIPRVLDRGIHVQLVTSAFRPLSPSWATLPHMNIVVSIDGLQPEHDVRRAPATYDRILKNIAGQKITRRTLNSSYAQIASTFCRTAAPRSDFQ